MCRLFALAADHPVTARFWPLDAPYSLREQSHHNADGTGVGWIDESGTASVAKRPIAAFESERFEHVATSLTARTMLAHIRLSSGTCNARENTHPFLMHGIVAAHNGVLQVTEAARERVRALGTAELIDGDTDSEWLIALIAGEVARLERDGAARDRAPHDGIVAALDRVARTVPVYSANLVLARDNHLYAVRLPATNELWVLDRPAGDGADQALDQRSDRMQATSDDLRDVHSVVIASEPMDDGPDWRLLADGELVHVDPDGLVTTETPFPELAHPLTIEDLGLSAAASQAHDAQIRERRERRRAVAEAAGTAEGALVGAVPAEAAPGDARERRAA